MPESHPAERGTTGSAPISGQPALRQATRGDAGLRRMALGISLTLIVQYLLGIGVNLFLSVPAGDHGAGIGSAVGKAISHGPAALTIHASLGVLLIAGTFALVARTIAARRWRLATLAVAALACVISAAVNGARFVGTGNNGASMAMAVFAGAALACNVLICYLPTPPARG
jgi:hypothetical protein